MERQYDELGFVRGYLCACGGRLQLDHVDDAKTEWFKCEKCGKFTSRGSDSAKKELFTSLRDTRRKEDKPKIRNRCGGCAAFRTPFCLWEYQEYDSETMRALTVDAEAYACSRFYPRLTRPRKRRLSFNEKVENL
jgi:hypothetical protein